MSNDSELLRLFAEEGSQVAFAELVGRKINLVYATALRRVGGDTHLAHDVTQGVFVALAYRARSLQRHSALTGWLHTTTRFVAAKTLRAQRRREQRDAEASSMNATQEGEPAWEQLRPVIDEALHDLNDRDRDAILLRFFEGRSLAEVGAAIGLAENSARMRVERALEKLRARLARVGITSTSTALGLALAQQPNMAAPAGLAASAANAGFVAATLSSGGAIATAGWVFQFMGTTKVIWTSAGIAAAIAIGAYLGAQSRSNPGELPRAVGSTATNSDFAALRRENQQLKSEVSRLQSARDTAKSASANAPSQSNNPSSAVMARLQVIMDLKKRQLANPEIAEMIGSGARLTPAFVQLFALTPAEQDVLQRSIDTSREQIASLERENSTVTRTSRGDVVITLKAFPETGGVVYDNMLKTFADTLGPERHNAFLALGAEQMEKALGRFGTPQRTLTFSQTRGSGDDVHYALHETFRLPKENGNYSSDFKTFDELINQAGTIANLLPADFGPRK